MLVCSVGQNLKSMDTTCRGGRVVKREHCSSAETELLTSTTPTSGETPLTERPYGTYAVAPTAVLCATAQRTAWSAAYAGTSVELIGDSPARTEIRWQ